MKQPLYVSGQANRDGRNKGKRRVLRSVKTSANGLCEEKSRSGQRAMLSVLIERKKLGGERQEG